MDDYKVVDDSFRARVHHRGQPTPQYVLDLLDGKTLRLPRKPNGAGIAKKYGFIQRYYRAQDEEGGYIVWFEKVQP